MKDNIFTELYNRVMGFFTPQSVPDPTKNVAINRLKTVLMQDRAGFSERSLQMMREEMLVCISKYMDLDEESFELQLDASDNATILNLSIPVVRAHTDEEVDEIIKKQEEDVQERAKEIVLKLEDLIEEKAKAISEEDSNKDTKADDDKSGNEEEEENKEEKSSEIVDNDIETSEDNNEENNAEEEKENDKDKEVKKEENNAGKEEKKEEENSDKQGEEE